MTCGSHTSISHLTGLSCCVYKLSHKSDPGEKLRHGVVLRASATLVDLTLVLWTPGPIRSYREEFLPEGLRAYGRPLYGNLMFLVRRRLFFTIQYLDPFITSNYYKNTTR